MAEPTYTLEIRENGKQLSREPMADPFHTTTITVRGRRQALRILLHRYQVQVRVNADPLTIERVMHLSSDYLPTHGHRREDWNRDLHEALSAMPDPPCGANWSCPVCGQGAGIYPHTCAEHRGDEETR